MVGVLFPVGARDLSPLHRVKPSSITQAYRIGTGDSFPEVKQTKRESDYSAPSSAEVKNNEAIHPLAINLHGVALN
jgi:hypothetical protein